MIAFMIYLLTVVDNVISTFSVFTGIFTAFLFICGVIYMVVNDTTSNTAGDEAIKKNIVKWSRKGIPLTTIAWILITFIPNSKTIAAMYLVPKLVNNEQVQELPSKLMRVVNLKMDTWIDDLVDEEKPAKESE